MEGHIAALEKLCRLCCNKIVEDRHFKAKAAMEYVKIIENIYELNIMNDKIHLHPQNVCKKCYMKLYHLSKKCQKSMKGIYKQDVYLFEEHTNDNCIICQVISKVGAPIKDVSSYSEIVLIAKQNGFEMKKKSNQHELSFIKGSKIIRFINLNEWELEVVGFKIVPAEAQIKTLLPKVLNTVTADSIFNDISNSLLCCANDDFKELAQSRFINVKEFQSPSKDIIANVETADGHKVVDLNVIRHLNCSILVKTGRIRCDKCTDYRKALHTMESRRVKNEEGMVSPKMNDRYLSEQQKLDKLKYLENERKKLTLKLMRMQQKINTNIQVEGIKLNNDDSSIVEEVMQNNKEQCPFTVNSPQYLLWQQQQLQCSLSNKKSMKWHPLIIRWCISIYLKSPGTYKHIRSSPFINLPCKNTLLKYINFTEPGCGFNIDIIERLAKKLDIPKLSERGKQVSLIFDEMKIKCGLVYSTTTGKLVGFNEMGDINDEFALFEQKINKESEEVDEVTNESSNNMSLAKYVIVFMVRGIGSSLCYPFGHFASDGFTSDQIYHSAWEAIGILEQMDLKVHAIIADGASPNRKFMKLHKLENEENMADGVVYWTWNEWCSDRKIYFICDVPHLIKTTRNNLENYGGNSNTRNLMINGHELGWMQIINLYEWDLGLFRDALGLRMGHKLREEMINLTPQSRMYVSYAAKVLSSTVSKMLEEQGSYSTTSLRTFILKIDEFFDCLNVSRPINKSNKPALNAYKSINDPRFEWLQKDFLGFLDDWEEEVSAVVGLTKTERNKRLLSKQTRNGLRTTVHSFVSLCKHLLTEYKFEFILSEKFSQDPLEEYFSKQRFRGGCNDNPTLQDVNRNILALNVA